MATKSIAIMLWMLLSIFTVVHAESAKPIFPYPYKTTVLENGLKVILIPMDSQGLAEYYSIVRTGSRDEVEPGHSGFAHFFEHMMFRGTKTYPGPVYDRLITEIGADANAYTSNDLTVYHINIAAKDLGQVMKLESDRFQNLSYSEQAFKTEAGAVHGEYLKNLSNPWTVLYEKLMDTAFDVHTYKHTTMGFRKDIEAMPAMYEYSLSFFNRYYRPDNVVLLIVGDIREGETLDLVRKYYGGWKKGYIPPQTPVEPGQIKERRADVAFNGKSLPILALAYKSPAYDPNDVDAVSLTLLGELIFGETSEVYKKLVLDEQKVQFIQPDFSLNRDPGLVTVFTMVNEEKDLPAVESELDQAVARYCKTLVDQKRLNDIVNHDKYQFLMNLDTPDNVAANLAGTVAITGGMEAINKYYDMLDKVTPQTILDAVNAHLVKEKCTAVVLKGRK